jgi:hypothetical protein
MKPLALALADGGQMKVTYDGHTVELPDNDGDSVSTLYRRWQAVGKGAQFEVRDAHGRLIAIGERLHQLKNI